MIHKPYVAGDIKNKRRYPSSHVRLSLLINHLLAYFYTSNSIILSATIQSTCKRTDALNIFNTFGNTDEKNHSGLVFPPQINLPLTLMEKPAFSLLT